MSVSPSVDAPPVLYEAREPRLSARVGAWLNLAHATRPLDACLALTVLTVIVHTQGYAGLPLTMMGVAAFYRPALLRSSIFWAVVAGLRAAGMWSLGWYALDNHQYLLTYWCMALSLGLAGAHPESALRVSARLLIGLCFAFATAWKILAPDFLDGSFFEFILITGIVPSQAAQALAQVPAEVAATNAAAVRGLAMSFEPDVVASLSRTHVVTSIAPVAALLTAGFEGLLALAFLWPVDRGLSRVRDGLLVLFGVGTYVLLPVFGFGWLLAALGLAQVTRRGHVALVAYVGMFAMILVGLALEAPATFVTLGGLGCLLGFARTRSVPLLVAGGLVVCGGTGLVLEWRGVEGAGALGLACGFVFAGTILLAGGHPGWARMLAAAVPPVIVGALAIANGGTIGPIGSQWWGLAGGMLVVLATGIRRRQSVAASTAGMGGTKAGRPPAIF